MLKLHLKNNHLQNANSLLNKFDELDFRTKNALSKKINFNE